MKTLVPLLAPRPTGGRGRCRCIMSAAAAVGMVALVYLHLAFSPSSPADGYHDLFLSLGSNATAAAHLFALTRSPHVAGSAANAADAAYVAATLSSLAAPSHSAFYDVLLSYPLHRSLSLFPSASNPAAVVRFNLTQETYPGDPYAAVSADAIPTFYAYAKSGSVVAEVVYANYGRDEDYAYLAAAGVAVAGAVALVRYGEIHCEDIAKNARDAGAAAVVVYTDPDQYSGGPGAGWFPESRWLPPTGVQVGSLFRGVGDPTTPMWASSKGCERLPVEEAMGSDLMPLIPALPVSSADGLTIHSMMGGPVAPQNWQGVKHNGPAYRLGPGPALLNLTYAGNDTLATIQNVFGVIKGHKEPDRYVLLGNHRDAWTFGGADPNSASASMLEIAHRFWILQKKGWKPRRTIIFCSWDAEEYGLTGSTEWAEENQDLLFSRAVAYLNVDVSVVGPGFHGFATPQLDELLKEVTKKVQDPDNSSRSVYDQWTGSASGPLIGRLGGGGTDYAAFLQHVGIPSTDFSFGEGPGYPVYHSLYDDYIWMEKFGDPGFHRHVAAASIWGLLALRLADEEILPFNYTSYALELEESTRLVESEAHGMPVDFSPLHNSITDLKKAAIKVGDEQKAIKRSCRDPLKVRELNDRLMMAERAFTSQEGLSSDPWQKHLVYGPAQSNDWDSLAFPGIVDAIAKAKGLHNDESWRTLQHEIYRVARVMTQASLLLAGKLT